MINEYGDPNICYAIGDAVSVMLGTATTTRQPASGVEEQLSALVKEGTTDSLSAFDGSAALGILAAAVKSSADVDPNVYNIAYMSSNAVYIRKEGTTDVVQVSGVQTNV